MKISQYRSLRGGGIVCSHQQLPKKVQSDCGIDDDLIQHLIHDIECKCHGILDASKRIGLNESKENIMMNIGWFHKSSQFIHQIRQNKKMVQENIKIVQTNLEVLLEAIINIIQSQRFYTWLILKICNAFSLLIFIYFINNPNPPMKLQDQEKLLQYLAEIQQYLKVTGQANSYENSIQYEFELLQMCIQTCPTNSKEGQEIIINTFSGIISSIAQMSPSSDLISALGQGALYLYKENSKRKQKEIFQIIFYLEELKWQIIELIQNGKGLHNILMILGDNYKKLVEKSHCWIIRCSWIKMISELISHKPVITFGRFHQLMHQFKLDKTWDQVILQKVVKPIDENKLIGVIQKVDSNEQAIRILQQQYTIFEQLQNVCLNGNQDIPKFENLIQFNEKESQEKNTQEDIDKIVKLQQYIENIKINQLQEASKQLLTNYQDYIDGFINLKDYINSNHKQFLQQIDYLSMQSSNVNQQLYDYYLQSNILDQQLLRITQLSDEVINKNNEILIDKLILVELIKSYFNIIMELKYNLGSFKEEFEQFSMYFPENNLKITLTSQEFKLFIQDIFDQIKDNDFNQLIIKLEFALKNQRSKIKMNPILLIRRYSEVSNQLQFIIFTNLRQDFNIEQQYLLYFEQLISYDKKILEQNFNQIQIKKQQFNYSIISVLGHLYEQLTKQVFELKFDMHQAEQFKPLQLSQVLQVYNSQIQLEVNQLQIYQLIRDPIQKQDNVNFIVQLLTQNKILQKIRNNLLESSSSLSQIKTKINKLKSITNETNQQPQIIEQLIKNRDQLNNYLNMENNQDILNLIDIFSQRNQLLQHIKESKYDIDNNLIENTIKINQILELEGFQKIQQVQLKIIQQSKENFDLIIDTITNHHNQQSPQDEVGDLLNKVLTNIDQLIIKLNNQQIIQQNLDENQYQSLCNQLILKISQCMQNEKEQNENLQMELEQAYDKIIQEFGLIIIFNKTNIEEIIQSNFDLIRQLPSLPIPEEYIQDVIFSHHRTKIYEQKAKQAGFLQTIQDSLNDEQWRIKEYFYFNCLIIYESVNNQSLKNKIGQIILYGKFKETDFRVIQTLKNQEYKQQMEQLITHQWQESKDDIKVQLQDSLNKLQNIQLQLQGEERKAEREKLQQQHRDLEDQIEQQLKNVNEIGDVLGITINFLKDIQKDLAAIQKKLDNILNQIESMGQDIKFLRGKSPQQLLEIRMEYVISNKIIQDSQSVYVQIYTKEFDIEKKKEKEERTPLFNHENNDTGEVDEFLDQPGKSSMLIHGIAGAGKSLSARKIEEHLWLQYQKNTQNKSWDQIKDNITIPIFIQLPALKEPKFNAIEETLESAIYQFDQKQINQFKEIVQSNNKIKLLFIMDSYDELAKQYQQINLIQTNKVNQWKHPNEKNNPKVITTSRSEIFTNTYRSWFYGDNTQTDNSLKEVRLLSFDEEQRFLFLKQYSQLQLKLKIKELLEIISKNQSLDNILQNTLIIFDKIQSLINQEDQFILSNQSSQQIIDTISKHPNLLQINKEQQKSFNKQLQILWSAKQYEVIIKQLNLKEMLETPFFLNIVVAVLPQMNEKLSSQTYIKLRFSEYYKKNKTLQIQNIISNYECKKLNYQDKYDNNEIQELKHLKHDIFINEAHKVWDCLIDSNFFKHFNASKQCMDIIELLNKSLNQREEIFSITEKEPDNQNYLVIYNSLITKTQTIYDFYQEFLNHYIEQQRQKLSYSSEISDQNRFLLDIQEYAMKLAVAMTKLNETVIEIKQQGILYRKNTNKDPYSEFFQDQDKYANYRMLIRKCLPIKQKANFFQFHHKSIQEYLFAKQIVEFLQQISQENQLQQIIELRNKNKVFQNIEDIQIKDQDFFYTLYNNTLNQDIYLSSSQMQGQLRFIKAALQYQSKLQNTCYLLSLLSSICPKFVQFSSNALSIYSNLVQYIENKDFSKILIENIPLDGINFVNCNFSDSQLRKASINGINLISSNLQNINWIDCYSNDLPNFRGTQSPITCLRFLGDEKNIICGSQDGSVSLWNKQQAKILNQFMANKDFQIIDIIPLQNDDEIQYAVFQKQFNDDRKYDMKLQFWKIQNNFQSFLMKDVQIDSFYDCHLWSHNNQYLVYNQLDQICIYDLKKLKILLKEEFKRLIYFQLSENNLLYIIVNENICLWNFIENIKQSIKVDKMQEVLLQDQKNNNFSHQFKFSGNLKFLAMKSGEDFYLFNVEANSHIQLNLQGIQVIEFSQNQQYLGIGGDYLVIFDIENQCITQKLYGLNEKIQYIYFNSNVTEIITLSKDGLVQYWDLQQCLQSTQQLSSNLQAQIDQVQYSLNGQLFFVQTNGQIYIYDSNTGLQVDSIEFNVDMFTSNPIQDELYFQKNLIWFSYNYYFKTITKLDIRSQKNLIISPDGQLIWTYDDSLNCEPRVFWWVDFVDKVQIIQIDNNKKILSTSYPFMGSSPCFSKDCKTVYYFNGLNVLCIECQKDANTGIYQFLKQTIQIDQLSGYNVRYVYLSPDDKYFFLICAVLIYGSIKYYYLTIIEKYNKQICYNKKEDPLGIKIPKIGFQQNNKYIILTNQSVIKILHYYDYQTFLQIREDLFGHIPYTKQVIQNPNGCQFITLGEDNKIKIWEYNKNFTDADQQKSLYYLKATIPQKSTQNVLIHESNTQNAKILSHLGYNIFDKNHYKFNNPYSKQ